MSPNLDWDSRFGDEGPVGCDREWGMLPSSPSHDHGAMDYITNSGINASRSITLRKTAVFFARPVPDLEIGGATILDTFFAGRFICLPPSGCGCISSRVDRKHHIRIVIFSQSVGGVCYLFVLCIVI